MELDFKGVIEADLVNAALLAVHPNVANAVLGGQQSKLSEPLVEKISTWSNWMASGTGQ